MRIIVRLIADAVLVAAMLFVPAGTITWPRAWVLLASMLIVRLVGAAFVYRVNPDLLRERSGSPIRSDQLMSDRLLLLGVLGTGFLGLPVVAGIDRFHLHAFSLPSPSIGSAGLSLFVLGWVLKSAALRANRFAVTAVRHQSERGGQTLVESGPYSVVRHPFYAADPFIFLGLGLWLESYLAVIVSVIPISLMLMRLQLEERFLRRVLPEYAAYAERVQYRLIPGIY